MGKDGSGRIQCYYARRLYLVMVMEIGKTSELEHTPAH